ncbi:MAG: hypothetical protein D4R48_00025 [Nitrosomonadales bacterium]|nr:MAG: hypothetical protein D4R48_00025 [Nitrosomonadales bacterium]
MFARAQRSRREIGHSPEHRQQQNQRSFTAIRLLAATTFSFRQTGGNINKMISKVFYKLARCLRIVNRAFLQKTLL